MGGLMFRSSTDFFELLHFLFIKTVTCIDVAEAQVV